MLQLLGKKTKRVQVNRIFLVLTYFDIVSNLQKSYKNKTKSPIYPLPILNYIHIYTYIYKKLCVYIYIQFVKNNLRLCIFWSSSKFHPVVLPSIDDFCSNQLLRNSCKMVIFLTQSFLQHLLIDILLKEEPIFIFYSFIYLCQYWPISSYFLQWSIIHHYIYLCGC